MVLTRAWAYKHGFMYPFQLFIALVKLPFWVIVIVLAAYRFFFGHDIGVVAASWFDPWWHIFRPLIFVSGVVIIRALRGLPYLISEPKAFLFLPLYAFISPFILAPYKLYAMLTARDTKWLTRGKENDEKKTAVNYVTTGAIIICILFSLPVIALGSALADDESDSY